MHGGCSCLSSRELQIERLFREAAELADPTGEIRAAFEQFESRRRQILENLLRDEGWPAE